MNINIQGRLFSIDEPIVMGILNVTENSFYDGGQYLTSDAILQRVEKLLLDGAKIIDVGACSTRPGADEISAAAEIEKVRGAVSLIRNNFPEAVISVDTWRASVAEVAAGEGANIINDISGGDFDTQMLTTVGQLRIPYVLTHTTGKPEVMQERLYEEDLLPRMMKFFSEKILLLKELGAKDIIIDPGLGFGKSLSQNYFILKNLSAFSIFDFPLLIGASRKSMIYNLLNISPAQALNGTTAINTLALLNGAKILRVHDVREAVETIKIFKEYSNCDTSINK